MFSIRNNMGITVRTNNWKEMLEFYRHKLRLKELDPQYQNLVHFKDFGVEIRLEHIANEDPCHCYPPDKLILYTYIELNAVEMGLRERRVNVEKINGELTFTDTDSNDWRVVNKNQTCHCRCL
tara:strand:+ start:77 stop:445 length:369 start_codon:yes stop_codon:yes gene_type:complete